MKLRMIAVCLGVMLLSGCQYYQVTEPAGRHTYITDNWHMSVNGFVFTDLATGDTVRLMSAEYKPISSEDAKAEIAAGGGGSTSTDNSHD